MSSAPSVTAPPSATASSAAKSPYHLYTLGGMGYFRSDVDVTEKTVNQVVQILKGFLDANLSNQKMRGIVFDLENKAQVDEAALKELVLALLVHLKGKHTEIVLTHVPSRTVELLERKGVAGFVKILSGDGARIRIEDATGLSPEQIPVCSEAFRGAAQEAFRSMTGLPLSFEAGSACLGEKAAPDGLLAAVSVNYRGVPGLVTLELPKPLFLQVKSRMRRAEFTQVTPESRDDIGEFLNVILYEAMLRLNASEPVLEARGIPQGFYPVDRALRHRLGAMAWALPLGTEFGLGRLSYHLRSKA